MQKQPIIKKITKKIPIIIFGIIFLFGLAIMLYPTISNMISVMNYNGIIDNYSNEVSKHDKAYNSLLYRQAYEYNKTLTSTSMSDAFTYPTKEESDVYKNTLNVSGNGVMAYISIPKINIRIPIYHGTSSKVLEKGVGHLEGSSLPIGGEGNHVILSAHRGLPSAKLFTDVDQLREGDQFYIYVLNDILAYQVDQIKVIKPSQLDSFVKEEDKDYVTLVTCTPYGVNTHRLLIRGTRVEYKAKEAAKIEGTRKLSKADIFLCSAIVIVIIIIIVSIILTLRKKRPKKDEDIEIIGVTDNNDDNDVPLI